MSLAEVMRKLRLKVGGANYATVNRKIKALGLDTSHFTGKRDISKRFYIC